MLQYTSFKGKILIKEKYADSLSETTCVSHHRLFRRSNVDEECRTVMIFLWFFCNIYINNIGTTSGTDRITNSEDSSRHHHENWMEFALDSCNDYR